MYDAMDPEFREMPPECAEETPFYYGTGRRPKAPSSHMPLTLLLLCLLLAANAVTALVLLRLHEQRTQDGAPKATDAVLSDTPSGERESPSPTVDTDGILPIKKAQNKELSLSEIYEKATPSLAVVSTEHGGGTAVILTSDGYLLTNADTLTDARTFTVTLSDGASYAAQPVGTDKVSDLAVLKIEAKKLTAAEFGDSDSLRAGQEVAAVSNPFGADFSPSITAGSLASVDSSISLGGRDLGVLQTDAALNAAGAGGPLYNRSGQLVGFNVSHISDYASYSTVSELGFALPIRTVDALISDLITYGYIRGRADLGMEVESLDPAQRRYWNLPEGVIVSSILRTSGAYIAGVRPGDVLISLGGMTISDESSYRAALNRREVGQSVEIIIYRGGQQYSAKITLGEANAENRAVG